MVGVDTDLPSESCGFSQGAQVSAGYVSVQTSAPDLALGDIPSPGRPGMVLLEPDFLLNTFL